jgi:hypothetical protein
MSDRNETPRIPLGSQVAMFVEDTDYSSARGGPPVLLTLLLTQTEPVGTLDGEAGTVRIAKSLESRQSRNFESGAFGHSATSPCDVLLGSATCLCRHLPGA